MRATRTLEGWTPSGQDWHRQLLDGAALAIHKVRPALLSAPSHVLADWLLRFRHFLRHAYAADLEPARVGELISQLASGLPALQADLDAAERWFALVADELEP